ncbi:MAG: ExbD/TolR family protein [Alcanivorax sp.]|uniref:ExbD/TolR family protein n=1 Tax=Alcanivorax sp. TaxID=1872427 RepID=UPI003DA71405
MQTPYNPPQKLASLSRRRKSPISLTPLIDVVFILLVFFMLASSFMDWRSLSLDTSAAGEPAPSDKMPFVVQIGADSLRLNGESMSPEQLIEQARSRPKGQPVSLQPLADTPVQAVVVVMDALNEAWVQPLRLVEDPQWQPTVVDDGRGDQ